MGLGAGLEAGLDTGLDAGLDAGLVAGLDAGLDAGLEAGLDAVLDSCFVVVGVAVLVGGLAAGLEVFFFFFFTVFFLFGSLALEVIAEEAASGVDWARLPPPVTAGLDLSAKSSPCTARDCLGPPGPRGCLRTNPMPSRCFCTEGELLPPRLWSA